MAGAAIAHPWPRPMHAWLIRTRMHANSDTEAVTHMCGLHNGEIRFTLMNVVFKQW